MKPWSSGGYAYGMDITNWARLDDEPETVTLEEYRRLHADAVGLTLEQFHRWVDVEPCDCGDTRCVGWAAKGRRTPRRGTPKP